MNGYDMTDIRTKDGREAVKKDLENLYRVHYEYVNIDSRSYETHELTKQHKETILALLDYVDELEGYVENPHAREHLGLDK